MIDSGAVGGEPTNVSRQRAERFVMRADAEDRTDDDLEFEIGILRRRLEDGRIEFGAGASMLGIYRAELRRRKTGRRMICEPVNILAVEQIGLCQDCMRIVRLAEVAADPDGHVLPGYCPVCKVGEVCECVSCLDSLAYLAVGCFTRARLTEPEKAISWSADGGLVQAVA